MPSDTIDRGATHSPADDDFVAALRDFASELPASDHAILVAVLNAAMGPWERMAARPAEEFLDPAEVELVDRLAQRADTEVD